MPTYALKKTARKAVGKPRYLTLDEVKEKSRQVIRAMPVDPYGFLVYARGKDRHNVYASPKMRKRASQLFAKAFPQQKDYADAYGIGMDMSYYTSGEENLPIIPTPEFPDRKTNIGMWQSRNSVENSGRKFKIWAKAFDLGRRDGAAIKQMHLAFRKTGKFPIVKVSSVLTHAKTLTADADTEEVDLIAGIESVFHADGSKYFSAGAFDYARDEAMPVKSRATIVLMSPYAFLAMAKNLPAPNTTKTANVASANGNFRDLPRLIFENNGDGTATVIGHEGRHRMYYLKENNIKRVPVLFISQPGSGPSIRWGSATGMDAVDPWPKVLKGEGNGNQMPFPVSEIYPRSIVAEDINYRYYGYWITNEGKFIGVDTEEHAETAHRWLKKNDPVTFESLKEDNRVYDYKAFDTLMDRGWIHVTQHRHSCEIQIVNRTVRFTAYKALRRYLEGSEIETISVIVHNREGSPLRKTFTDYNQTLEFVRRYMARRTLTALIEAAELEIKAGGKIKVHRGEYAGNKGGMFWTEDREFARNFTQSGQDKEIRTRYIDPKDIDESAVTTFAGNEAGVTKALAHAKKNGFKALRLSEGDGEPLSLYVFDKSALTLTATDREKHYGKSLYEQGKTDFLVIYRAVPRAEINFKPGDYVTLSKKFAVEHAEHNAAIGEPSHVIKIVADPRNVYDALNPGEYFYGGGAKRGKVFYTTQDNMEGSDMRSDLLAGLQERMKTLHAENEKQSYTNKTKSVKAIFYSRRSTPQLCKPGQTVKAKAGYGKRTKIRSLTPDELSQVKSGKWLRTRETGKKPGEKGAKKTQYRPWLVASIEQRLEAAGLR